MKQVLLSLRLYSLIVLLLASSLVQSASYTSVTSGDWNNAATWGGSGNPVAGDIVNIANGHHIIVTADASCASVNFTGESATLTVNSSCTLSVSNGVTLNNIKNRTTTCVIEGPGKMTCGSLVVGNGVPPAASVINTTMTSTISDLVVLGNLSLNSATGVILGTRIYNNAFFNQDSGTVTVNGSIVLTDQYSSSTTITLGALQPVLILNGASPFILNAAGTKNITFSNAGATVCYNRAGAQNVCAALYSNLTLSGNGIKTISPGSAKVKGILSMEGTATASAAVSWYDRANNTLQYKGSAPQITGPEFNPPFYLDGGIKIENDKGVTLNSAKDIGSNPLTIGSTTPNSKFSDGGYPLSGTGMLTIVSGTFSLGSSSNATSFPAFTNCSYGPESSVTFVSGVAQTIAAKAYPDLTLSGPGTKTFAAGNVTIAGNITNNASLFSDNACTINLGGIWTNNGTFSPGTGSVCFNGAASQSISGTSLTVFNNLITGSGGGVTTIAAGAKVTVNASLTTNDKLTVDSDAHNNGSLVVKGTSSGAVTYNRYLDPSRWYIVSSPVKDAAISPVVNSNNVGVYAGTYDFAAYDEATDGWNFNTPGPGNVEGNFVNGGGYLLRTLAPGIQPFKGPLNEATVSAPVTFTNPSYGWNSVGNPFTSSIRIKDDLIHNLKGFLTENKDILQESYAAVYLWNETAAYDGSQQYYRVIGNAGYAFSPSNGISALMDSTIQAGQGFIVKVKNAGTINFPATLQAHDNSRSLKAARISWPGITLMAQSNGQTRSAAITFNANMTAGLDITYDAGLLSSSDFSLYTHLLSGDNGVNFAIQCLPDNLYSNLSVPVGLDLAKAGTVTFRATGILLPKGIFPILEDRLLNIKTPLNSESASYKVTLNLPVQGTGRFYLHFGGKTKSLETEPDKVAGDNFTARFAEQKITVYGIPGEGDKAWLFDMGGKLYGVYNLTQVNENIIPATGLPGGLYLIKIIGKNQSRALKVPVIRNY